MNYAYFFVIAAVLCIGHAVAADADNDGVPDGADRCPDTAQIKKIDPSFNYAIAVSPERRTPGRESYPVDERGCELDDDGDGVINSADYCRDDPKEALVAGVALNGCPVHSDSDGTPDYRDKCPGTPRGVRTDPAGCPVS